MELGLGKKITEVYGGKKHDESPSQAGKEEGGALKVKDGEKLKDLSTNLGKTALTKIISQRGESMSVHMAQQREHRESLLHIPEHPPHLRVFWGQDQGPLSLLTPLKGLRAGPAYPASLSKLLNFLHARSRCCQGSSPSPALAASFICRISCSRIDFSSRPLLSVFAF